MSKKIISGFYMTILISVFLTCSQNQSHNTTEEFAKGVFKSFKNNKFNDFYKYYINIDDYEYLYNNNYFVNEKSKKSAEMKLKNWDSKRDSKRIKKEAQEMFTKIRNEVIKSGHNWEDAEYMEFECRQTQKRNANLEMFSKMLIYFTYKNKTEVSYIIVKEPFKSKRGWVLTDIRISI